MADLRRARSVLLAALLAGATPGCETAPVGETLPPVPEIANEPPAGFSWEGAAAHQRALARIGARESGSDEAARARAYIADQLERLGLEVREQWEAETAAEVAGWEAGGEAGELPEDPAPGELRPKNLLAEIPGESDDVIVLAAPYESSPPAADGGAALLLELGRVIAGQPLPYTTWLLFLDAESPRSEEPDPGLQHQLFGSRLQAGRFLEQEAISRIRLLVAFDGICDPDLRVARDLFSHRIYREDFWQAAARLGYDQAFPIGSFESQIGSHLPFMQAGVRVVAIQAAEDEAAEAEAAPEAEAEAPGCAPESLDAVGRVTVEALDRITRRLAKIDRFSSSPLAQLEESRESEQAPLEPAAGEPPPEPPAANQP